MTKVENEETLRMITGQIMKTNRKRNRIAILAIALTTLMVTSLFGGTASLFLSRRSAETRQSQCSAHAIVQELTREETERVLEAAKKSSSVKKYGTGTFLGTLKEENSLFWGEVRQGDKNIAESYFSRPTKGRMPEEENEIAVGTLVLDALGLPRKIGTPITITWETDGQTGEIRTDQFVVCGFWKSDSSVSNQVVWVSEQYVKAQEERTEKVRGGGSEDAESGGTEKVQGSGSEDTESSGTNEVAVWFYSTWNLQQKADELSEKAGLQSKGKGFWVNVSYQFFQEDGISPVTLTLLLIFIMLAGYLIIYNIFNLSVKNDIRTYGLLKNVGATGKQLKKIVQMQVWRLSAAGIPCGLVAGILATRLMAPFLAVEINPVKDTFRSSDITVSVNPALLLLSAVFSLITVYLSGMQACRIVKRVSPVEALKTEETKSGGRISFGDIPMTWWGMACQNVMRNFKKGLVAMLSIALSLIVVNCIVMRVQGYNYREFEQAYMASDFQVDCMRIPYGEKLDKITGEVREVINQCPYLKNVGYVYYSEEYHEMEPHIKKVMENYEEGYQRYWTGYDSSEWENIQQTNLLPVHFLGISEAVFRKLQWRDQVYAWEEFQSGEKIIVDYGGSYTTEPFSYYEPGERFRMEYQSGKEKEYTVLGEALMPYALDYPYTELFYITVLVPETEFISMTGNTGAMCAAGDAKDGMQKKAERYIRENVEDKWELLSVSSVLNIQNSFQEYLYQFYLIGGFLVFILILIGIMNFFNTMSASIMGRKRELALLEAIGMTKKDLKKMVMLESSIYLSGSVLLSVLVTMLASDKIMAYVPGQAFFFHLEMTIWPCIIMLPLLFIIAFVIPKYYLEKMSGESIVERIRKE